MSTLRRVPVTWTTGIGGTGLSVFYTDSADDVTTNLATFFNAIKGLFPNAVSWSIPSSGDEIDDTTGHLTGGWTGGTAATISATGGVATYAAGTGTFVRWGTAGLVNSRRLKGRTFLCPLMASIYDSDGTLQPTHFTTINTAASTLAGVGKLQIWHRPPPGGTSGVSSQVTSGSAVDSVTSLRSRRS